MRITNTNRRAARLVAALIAALAMTALVAAGSASAMSATPTTIHFGTQVAGVLSAPITVQVTVDPSWELEGPGFIGALPGVLAEVDKSACSRTGIPATCDVKLQMGSMNPGTYTLGFSFDECPAVGGACSTSHAVVTGDVTVVAGPSDTTTTATPSANPSPYGHPVTFSAHVSPSIGNGRAAGAFQFYADGTPLGSPVTADASGNATSAPVSSLTGGNHTIVAIFTPTDPAHFNGSRSTAFTETITKASTTLVAAPAFGPVYTLHATLTSGGFPVPGQTIAFSVGSTRICSAVTDAQGVATCAPAGKQQIGAMRTATRYTASFAGDVNHFSTSTNAPVSAGKKS